MPKRNTDQWKAVERKVAQILGGARVGNRGLHVQAEDVTHDRYSVEVKHGKCIPKFVTDAYAQAKRNAPVGKVPLVVLHAHGSQDYLAVLPLEELAALQREVVE